jgi:hypothetical protein
MKTPHFKLRTLALTLGIGLAFFVVGCGNSAQRKAYEQAAKAEQQLIAENAAGVIAEYKRVVALQPDSEWAGKARARIEAVEARIKAEDLRKSVFQEHGVD